MDHQKEKYPEASANSTNHVHNGCATVVISYRKHMDARSKVPQVRKRDRRASVDYIGSMSRELAAMARNEGCGLLSYMLEVAAIEAERMGGAPKGQSAS